VVVVHRYVQEWDSAENRQPLVKKLPHMLQGNLAANARCGRIFSDDSILQIFVSQWQDFLHCTLQQLINHYRNLTMGLPLGSFIIGKIAWTGQLCCL